MKNETRILVITGSRKEYKEYRRKRGIARGSENITRVRTEGVLLSIDDNTELVLYGSWWLNPIVKTWTYRYLTLKGPWEK